MIDLILFALKAVDQLYPNETEYYKKQAVIKWLEKQNIGMSISEISHHIDVIIRGK